MEGPGGALTSLFFFHFMSVVVGRAWEDSFSLHYYSQNGGKVKVKYGIKEKYLAVKVGGEANITFK